MKQQPNKFLRMTLLLLSSFLFFAMANAQNLEIKGKVIDAITKKPIDGANISVRNSNHTTATDADGLFHIMAEKGNVLTISFVGFETYTAKVTADKFLSVPLTASVNQMAEVVVTATGIKKEAKRLGYAVQTIDAS